MTREPLHTYRSLCTQYYDLETHPRDRESMAFYMDYALKANGPILEPMCGTGRFLIPMLQAGLDIEGFDASPQMLAALYNKLKVCGQDQLLQRVQSAFVQDFASDRRYSLIFVPYGSWGLMHHVQDSIAGLQIMYDHLQAGGKLVIDIETVASIPKTLNTWCRGVVTRPDGTQPGRSHIALNTYPTYNPQTQIFKAICRYESIVGATIEAVETEDFYMYLYRFDEFEQYARQIGFREIKKYQDYQKTPAVDPQAPILIYELIK